MGMFGVGPVLSPQLIAEIGDERRFHPKKALVALALTLLLTNLAKQIFAAAVFSSVVQLLCVELCFL